MNIPKKIRTEISDMLISALKALDLPADSLEITIPKDRQFGDFTTNIAMISARYAKCSPCEVAQNILNNMDFTSSSVRKTEIAGAGFINFYIHEQWLDEVIPAVESDGDSYGCAEKKNASVNIEYVSANPTGPMHMGNARGGALGDGIASVLERAGYDVTREFYLNDAGNQIEKFAASLEARYLQQFGDCPFPEDGYHGNDITKRALEFISEHGSEYGVTATPELRSALMEYSLEKNITSMKKLLSRYNINYDIWFHESSLYENDDVKDTIDELTKVGATYEKDDAVWLKSLDKDEVLVRSNGIPTYFAADIAYHRNKLVTRNFSRAINVWGADHHGHIARMKHALSLLGIDPERLHVVTMQMVRLVKAGETVKMSKRTGGAITLNDLLDDIGIDAARYFFNMRLPDSHFDFDLDLAVRQSSDNPVFYVQYAHARICSILSQIEERGVPFTTGDLTLLNAPEELALIRTISAFPDEIELAAQMLEPSRLTHYATSIAAHFHTFYNACRVLSDDIGLMAARARLINAAKITLKNTLSVLGVSAPERMQSR